MLVNLHVKNLALIDEIEVDFAEGLNILTGETGAGKSIIIGSISLALGGKMSRDMIRENAPFALVELVFSVNNSKILEELKKQDIFAEDGQIIITRKITGNRSISKINGEACTVAQIREAAGKLLDIHGQHEHQSLLYPAKQLMNMGRIIWKTAAKRSKRPTADTKNCRKNWRNTKWTKNRGSVKYRFWNLRFRRLQTQT